MQKRHQEMFPSQMSYVKNDEAENLPRRIQWLVTLCEFIFPLTEAALNELPESFIEFSVHLMVMSPPPLSPTDNRFVINSR